MTDKYPEISIIIPVYNLSKYIVRTLKSLENQEYHNFEVLVIDDGSKDDSLLKIKEFFIGQKSIKNYKIIESSNQGVGIARNKGLEISSGNYIYFLDGDDTVYPNFSSILSRIIRNQSKYNLDAIIFGYDRINMDNSKYFFTNRYNLKSNVYTNFDILNLVLKRRLSVATQNIVYNREFLKKNKLKFENYKQAQDVHFIFRCLVEFTRTFYINESLSVYHKRDGSTTTSLNFSKFDSVQVKIDLLDWIKAINKKIPKNLVKYQKRYMYYSFVSIFRMFIRKKVKPSKINANIHELYPNLYKDMIRHLKPLRVFKIMNIRLAKNNIISKYGYMDLKDVALRQMHVLKSQIYHNGKH